MIRALAIADDLTGAAEIAGLGVRYGLPTQLTRRSSARPTAALTVIDTDSRLLPPSDAASTVSDSIQHLPTRNFDIIYKKTDSLMRGPLLAEIEALMAALDKRAAILVAQNPSRGRTVQGGEYRIDGVPLHKTSLANDPEYPATSANVSALL